MTDIDRFNWTGKHILIVEDDKPSTILLTTLLSRTGAKLLYATNGQQAVDVFMSYQKVDLILMDVKMEGMSGIEAARIIHEIDPQVPIIAQTACVMAGDKEKCITAGCIDYVSKPIDAFQLLVIMDRHLSTASTYSPKKSYTEN